MQQGKLNTSCRCPKCNNRIDAYSRDDDAPIDAMNNPKYTPIFVCLYCNAVLQYTVNQESLVRLTDKELAEVYRRQPELKAKIKKAKRTATNAMQRKQTRYN
jgi:transcription initiation factor IIE alpha subunit